LLHSFHEAIEERARSNGVGLASLAALKTQIATHEQLFTDLNQVLITKMTELQREANRDFTPTIANIMHTVYDVCANEHGTGSFKRMKDQMSSYVNQYRHNMFSDATLTVKRHLDDMCKTLEEVMEEKADEIYVKMKADYMRVLGRVQHDQQVPVLPKEECTVRSEVMTILRSVNAHFEPIARGEFEDQDTTVDVAGGPAEEPVDADENDESAFESAREVADRDDNEDSIMDRNDDAVITEPPSSKRFDIDVDMDISSEKENHSLPTPSDEGMYETEM
jgi:hypothetical protein